MKLRKGLSSGASAVVEASVSPGPFTREAIFCQPSSRPLSHSDQQVLLSPELQGERRHHSGDIVMGEELAWNRKSNTLVVRLGEQLDLRLVGLIRRAIEALLTVKPLTLVVDLSATEKVFDSGVTLLLLLNHHAGHLRERILLANCGPTVYCRLARAGILHHFRWS
ncbi:STAS domain-containing protein [Thiorhodovibrio frisius]|nr:STAS domain-containing protein [Thiorhodovibrio frisius]